MEKIREKFSQIEDKRNESYIEHNLVDILILVMGAVVSGITELVDMMGNVLTLCLEQIKILGKL